eukprot:4585554-Pyramimonas_sp.AAC.1
MKKLLALKKNGHISQSAKHRPLVATLPARAGWANWEPAVSRQPGYRWNPRGALDTQSIAQYTTRKLP